MLTDDEKYLFSKDDREIPDFQRYTTQNAKDIIAVGFDPKKTFIFSDFDYMGGAWYKNVIRMQKKISLNDAQKVFGFDES